MGFSKSRLGYAVIDPASYKGDLTTIPDDVVNEVAWGIITIAPNASSYLLNSLNSPSSSFDSSNLVTFFYPEARQQSVYGDIVIPQISAVNEAWTAIFRNEWLIRMNNTLNPTQRLNVLDTNPNIAANPISITFNNLRPFTGDVSSAILVTGLIFLIIVSFFQIAFFAPVHLIMLGKIKFIQYMVYRPLINFISVLILSLAFSLVSLAFKADFTFKYGKAGFVVYWMINYLGMLSLGGASENMGIIIFNSYPQCIGFWLIFWVCINSSTSFAPLELCPGAYAIGKALPVHNAQMAIRTVLFDTRNRLGLNFGIFFAWVLVNYLVSFPCFALVKWYKGYQAKKSGSSAGASH